MYKHTHTYAGGAGGEGAVGQKRVGGAAGDEPAAKKHKGGSKGRKKSREQRRREANARPTRATGRRVRVGEHAGLSGVATPLEPHPSAGGRQQQRRAR